MKCKDSSIIDIQGHRGCRGLLPENTIPAFLKAIELGVHTLELDVAISKDNIVVVSHEPFMSRTICLDIQGNDIPKSEDKNYNLYQMSFESIKQFDSGLKLHPRFPKQEKVKTYKPSLVEVIQESQRKNPTIKFNIEIKAKPKYDTIFVPKPKEFVHLVLEVINENDVFYQTNLQSFDLRILEEIKMQSPKMKVAILVDKNENTIKKLNRLSFKPEIISPYFKLIDNDMIAYFQSKGYKIIPWTVNKKEDLKKMIQFKVDGIITDYPNKLIKILE